MTDKYGHGSWWGPKPKNDCACEGQQQITWPDQNRLEEDSMNIEDGLIQL
jgi:hypothetical protein